MGQFKPMVKMETTEPSVELKLKKGGHVNMKKGGKSEGSHKKMADGGGALDALMGTPALIGRPAVNAPVRMPGKPSMAMRRKAMMARPAMPPMKKGGKAEGGKMDESQDKAMMKKAFKQHDMQEHKGGKGTKLSLKKGGKMATGGVALGNGGGYKKGGKAMKFASGGIIKTQNQGGAYNKTLMHTAEYTGKSSGKTGDVKDGNGGGYATGGVVLGNGGGYKKGGSPKKAYAAGGSVNSGRPVAMPQGRKPASSPVRINQLAGAYKNGGKATPAEERLLKNNFAENKTAMREAKADSNLKYGSPKRMAGGGSVSDEYDGKNPKVIADKASRELEDALNPLSMIKEVYGKAKNYFRGEGSVSDSERNTPKNMSKPAKGDGSVTDTERTISRTVSPAGKKRGGRAY